MKENFNKRSNLTNEGFKGLFKNNFELTNQTIRLAKYYIRSGHEVSMDKLLKEIKRNPSPTYVADLESMESQEDANS